MPLVRANRRLVLLVIKFVIVQSGIYRAFEQHHSAGHASSTKRHSIGPPKAADKSGECAKTNNLHPDAGLIKEFAKLKRFALFLNHASICCYVYILIRGTMIEVMKFEQLADYQYLDCFILGRFRFIGRTRKVSNLILMLFVFVYLVYRYVVGVVAPEQFRFYALEFLADDYADVLIKCAGKRGAGRRAGHPSWQTSSTLHDGRASWQIDAGEQFDAIYHLKTTFDLDATFRQLETTQDTWIRRPNRTSKGWLILSRCSTVYFYLTVIFIVSLSSVVFFSNFGSIVSNMGFELAYGPACLSWIRDQQRRQLTSLPTTTSGNSTLR